MGDLTLILAAIIGIVMPALVSVIRSHRTPPLVALAIALGASGVAGFLTSWAGGDIVIDQLDTWPELYAAAAVVFSESQIVYHAWFKNTHVNELLNEFRARIDQPDVQDFVGRMARPGELHELAASTGSPDPERLVRLAESVTDGDVLAAAPRSLQESVNLAMEIAKLPDSERERLGAEVRAFAEPVAAPDDDDLAKPSPLRNDGPPVQMMGSSRTYIVNRGEVVQPDTWEDYHKLKAKGLQDS